MTATPDRRWTALHVLCTGMLMIVLDATVVNVALPAILPPQPRACPASAGATTQ